MKSAELIAEARERGWQTHTRPVEIASCVAHVAAVTNQLCGVVVVVVVVSVCSGSMVGQLLHWLGCWVRVLTCDSESSGKSSSNRTRHLTSFPM